MPAFVPVPSKSQILGSGNTIAIGGVTGVLPAVSFVPVGEMTDGKFTGRKRATTTNTNFDSGQNVQKLGTTLDFGTFTGTVNRVSNNAGQLAIIAANASGAAYDFQVQLEPNPLINQTTGDLYTMSGIVTEAASFDLSMTKVSEYTFTIELNSVTVVYGTIAG
jgi:hypothetical protein